MSMGQYYNDTEGETGVLVVKNNTVLFFCELMCMELWWNDIDRGKLNYWEKKLYSLFGKKWMIMEQYYNDTERGNWSIGRKNLYSFGVK